MAWYKLYERNPVAGGDWNGWVLRQYVPVSAYALGSPPTGTSLRVTVRAPATGNLNISSGHIGHGSPSGDVTDFDGTQAVLTGGSAINAGTDFTLGVAYPFTLTKPLVVSMGVTFPGNVPETPDPQIQFSGMASGVSGTSDLPVAPGFPHDAVIFPMIEVFFDDPPGNPTCTITRAPGQSDPSSSSSVQFRVDFNKGVTGLTSSDINLSASTVSWLGGSPVVTITGANLAYFVTITGMLTVGDISISIPANSVTAVADGLQNSASTTVTLHWDPNLIDPHKPNVTELTICDKNMLRITVHDPVVERGFCQVLPVPDTGSGTYAITNIVNNGHGMPRVTCPEVAASNGDAGGIYIQDITASPVSNGAGGQRIRLTVYATAGIVSSAIIVEHCKGTYEANMRYFWDSRPGTGTGWPEWGYVIIDSTHIDLTYRRHWNGSTYVDDTSKPSAFVNAYTGGGCLLRYSSGDGQWRTTIHSVTGTTEVNGAWVYARSGVNTIDLYNVPFVHTYAGGGRAIPYIQPTPSYVRPNPAKGGADDTCVISGRTGKRLRFQDRRPLIEDGGYLNRDAAKVPGDYQILGSVTHTVTNVYRKEMAYSGGYDNYVSIGLLTPIVTFRHYLYLKLDSNITNGTYTIVFPAGTNLPPKTFTYNDKTTRCCAIHADQNGHRPGDKGKYAYLAEWVPEYNTNGEVDYGDVTAWHLINSSGTVVQSFGTPPRRCTPTSLEGTVAADNVVYFPLNPKPLQTTGAPIKIDLVTNTNPAVVTVRNVAEMSRLNNGDMITFSDTTHSATGGISQLEAYFEVASKGVDGANKFRLAAPRVYPDPNGLGFDYSGAEFRGDPDMTNRPSDIPSHPRSPWATNSMDKGNWLYKVNVLGNLASTNVYGLDYSTFTTPGTYWIWLPGRGVSDPIYISESRHHRQWKMYCKAMYHQRSGIALDGRFGFTRPLNMKHIPGVQEVYKSQMPYCLSNYTLNQVWQPLWDIGGPHGITGGYDPWVTMVGSPAYGGHVDAGDWDVRINETWIGYFIILQVWSHLGSAAKGSLSVAQAGIPTCLAAGMDPVVFAGTNGLPAPLVEVIWGIEPQRLGQETSGPNIGGTIGGINYGEGVPDRELSSETTLQAYTWAVDHVATMNYAAVAAKLAQCLLDLGYTSLGNTYQASAIAAWNFAAPFSTGAGDACTIVDSVADAFYANVIDRNKSGWTGTDWEANKHNMPPPYSENQNFSNLDHYEGLWKGVTAAALFSLTGSSTYKTICDNTYPPGAYAGHNLAGAFEYQGAAGATPAIRTAIRTTMPQRSDYYLAAAEDPTISYVFGQARGIWNMSWGAAMNWQDNMHTFAFNAMIADEDGNTTYANRCRRVMQQMVTLRNGGNQMGVCMTNGLGVRHIRESLHLDSRNSSQDLPLGICSEGWAKDFPSYGGVFIVNSNTWFGAIQSPEFDPAFLETDPTLPAREMYPFAHLCFPIWEKLIEFHYAIEHMEYTTQQQIEPAYAGVMYLHGFDNNAAIDSTLAASTSVISVSPSPTVTVGTIVTFTCTVTGGSGTPTGTVDFKSDGVSLTVVALTAGVATLPISTLPIGSHAITAAYSGDSTYDPSSDTLTQTINSAAGMVVEGRLSMRMNLHA